MYRYFSCERRSWASGEIHPQLHPVSYAVKMLAYGDSTGLKRTDTYSNASRHR